jgi:hypothetical protein
VDSESDFFNHFAITVEDMNASLGAVIDGRDYQKPICVCGHPINWHTSAGNRSMCSFAKTYCRCQMPLAVIATSDLRYFKKLTRGPGADHALSLGCYSAIKANKSVRWIAEPLCFKCKSTTTPIRPVALNSLSSVTFGSGEINVLLCSSCYEVIVFS